MNYIQTISKIRGRGQLTIPQEIRQALKWQGDEVLVKIETTFSGFKVERLPVSHPQNPVKKLTPAQWQSINKTMENISRSGKQKISLTNVLRKDRTAHL